MGRLPWHRGPVLNYLAHAFTRLALGGVVASFDGALAAVHLAHVFQLLAAFGDGKALELARRGWRLTDEGYVTPGNADR